MQLSAHDLYGTAPQAPAYGPAPDTQHMAPSDVRSGLRGLTDPNNPLVWFGVFLLLTVGAASAAGSVRLGRARVRASVGS